MIGSVQLEDFIKEYAVCRDSGEDEEQFISRNEDNFAQIYVAIVSLLLKIDHIIVGSCRVLDTHL